jgi:hypothetical protein
MRIPKQIKIIGKTYTVKIVDEVDKDESWGSVCYGDSEILISKKTDYQTQCETLLHEITHIMFNCAGIDQNEVKVDCVGRLLFQVIPQIQDKL